MGDTPSVVRYQTALHPDQIAKNTVARLKKKATISQSINKQQLIA